MLLAQLKPLKFQAPKTKYQTNANDQNSKFKTGAMVAEHLLSDRNVTVIGISGLDITCPVK